MTWSLGVAGRKIVLPPYGTGVHDASLFFHVHDGSSTLDKEEIELRDIYAAQEQAICLSGGLLCEMGGKFWNGEEWSLNLTHEVGHILFTLRFSAKEEDTASV